MICPWHECLRNRGNAVSDVKDCKKLSQLPSLKAIVLSGEFVLYNLLLLPTLSQTFFLKNDFRYVFVVLFQNRTQRMQSLRWLLCTIDLQHVRIERSGCEVYIRKFRINVEVKDHRRRRFLTKRKYWSWLLRLTTSESHVTIKLSLHGRNNPILRVD